jgi:hypothetical protein
MDDLHAESRTAHSAIEEKYSAIRTLALWNSSRATLRSLVAAIVLDPPFGAVISRRMRPLITAPNGLICCSGGVFGRAAVQ